MKQAFTHRHTARGFSLLELMVAMTISLLLLMGVVALFISSRASYETTEKLSRIQENGRYALDQFASDIRSAGYQGCSRVTPGSTRAQEFAITSLRDSTNTLWNFAVPAQGHQGMGGTTFSPTLSITLSPAASAVGDVLVLRIPRRDARAVQLTVNQASPDAPLPVGIITPAPLGNGDLAMISDCEARAWFQVTGYAGGLIEHAEVAGGSVTSPEGDSRLTPGNEVTTLRHPFKAGAEIVPVTTVIYYLAPATAPAANPADPPRFSLWRKTGGSPTSDEIAEDIERFEVQYGVDTTNDGRVDSYVDATAITSWDRVYSVQVAVLSRAPDAYGTDIDNQTYTLFQNVSPALPITAGPFNDRFQRKVFTTTVAVRNTIID